VSSIEFPSINFNDLASSGSSSSRSSIFVSKPKPIKRHYKSFLPKISLIKLFVKEIPVGIFSLILYFNEFKLKEKDY